MAQDGIRQRNLYQPGSTEPYSLSRSKLQTFLDCPRCLYLDRRCGIGRPDSPPYTLNLAVDTLLKREFDRYRLDQQPHPLMTLHGIDAVPFKSPHIEEWRDAFRGIRALHQPSHFLVFGAVDDLWVGKDGTLIVVDYKATSTEAAPTLDHPYRDGYKRQMEIYQWLLRRNGFKVSPVAYFVFANAEKSRSSFDRRLEFMMQVLPYEGSDTWVDDALIAAHECLEQQAPPSYVEKCEWCAYRRAAGSREF